MSKRILLIAGAFAPIVFVAYLTVVPSADVVLNVPLLHFYMVTFTTFSAAVVSILLGAALIREAAERHVLAAVAFAFIGSMFFSHGIATPGALIANAHPAVRWSAWLTLLGGGLIFALASLNLKRLPLRPTVNVIVFGLLTYWGVAAFGPQYLDLIETQVTPWHREAIFGITMAAWLVAAIRFTYLAQKQPNRVDALLAMVSVWMIQATLSMHRYPIWNLSWWMYHIIMLLAFLITIAVLLIEYERVRQFSLMRYYVAASLIITASLALIASALFTEFSYTTALTQIETAAKNDAQNMAAGITLELREVRTAEELKKTNVATWNNILSKRLAGLSNLDVAIYDAQGLVLYSNQESWIGIKAKDLAEITETYEGKVSTEVFEPANPPDIYATPLKPIVDDYGAPLAPTATAPKRPTYILETYVPIRAAGEANGKPIAALATFQEIPEVETVNYNARGVGLITASATMGILFFALLTVVNRADKLITTRAVELQTAYSNLRELETMRDDLTNMIVHDLRNPLSAITASIDLMKKPEIGDKADFRGRILSNAFSASQRMTGMIDDMLAVGKMEAGELKPVLQTIELASFCDEFIKAYAAQIAADRKDLTINCPAELTIAADANLLRRTIDNLIGNALKYTEHKVELIVRPEPKRILFIIRDDGDGVPDTFKKAIFNKYQQAPNANEKPARKGTGLGLTFCRLVVEIHGGEIWVSDAPQKGSDFNFWLPR